MKTNKNRERERERHVADGEGEGSKGLSGGGRRGLRKGKKVEARLQKWFSEHDLGSASSFSPLSLGHDDDPGDAKTDEDPGPWVGGHIGLNNLQRLLPHGGNGIVEDRSFRILLSENKGFGRVLEI